MTILEFHREKDFQPVMGKECKEKNVTSVGTFPSVKLQTNEMVSQVSTDLRVKRKLIDAIIFTFSPHKKEKTELKRFPSLPCSSFVSGVVSGCDDSGAVMTIIGKKRKSTNTETTS